MSTAAEQYRMLVKKLEKIDQQPVHIVEAGPLLPLLPAAASLLRTGASAMGRSIAGATRTTFNTVRTAGQMASLGIKLGLPAAVAGNIAKVVYEYHSTQYPDEKRRKFAYDLMITKISVIVASTLAGMGLGSVVTIFSTLGLSALSKALTILPPSIGGIIGAELAGNSEIVNKLSRAIAYVFNPAVARADAVDASVAWSKQQYHSAVEWLNTNVLGFINNIKKSSNSQPGSK